MKKLISLALLCVLTPCLATSSEKGKTRLRIVFVGAHCDDNEVCAGGLMRMLADRGHQIVSAYGTTFRRGRLCLGKPEDEVRRAESTAACKLLGATPHFFSYSHEDLENPLADGRILKEIAQWLTQVRPDIVVTHWPIDSHPNHRSVAEAVLAAYRHSGHVWGKEGQTPKLEDRGWNLYFYEASTLTKWDDWESLGFRPNLYLDLGALADLKKQICDTFKSQAHYNLWNVQNNMQRQRGQQCNRKAAEAFFLLEARPGCPLLPVQMIEKP